MEAWRMKLLVIEDDPAVRDAVASSVAFHWSDAEVTAVGDGEAGLRRFFEEQPDAVVLDIGLPGISGLDVLRRIRQSGGAPVLILTARGSEMEVVRALEMGADDYVVKPCGYLELTARLKALLRRAEPPAGV